jgi:hypothetical protein
MATEYEEAREARIQENKRKIMELGIVDAVAGLAPAPAANPVRQKRQKVEPGSPTRRSERPRTVVNYAEKFEIAHIPREPRDYTQLINGLTLDPEEAERLRADVEARLAGGSNAGGKKRGPVDSGKGVRVQVRARQHCWARGSRPGGPDARGERWLTTVPPPANECHQQFTARRGLLACRAGRCTTPCTA